MPSFVIAHRALPAALLALIAGLLATVLPLLAPAQPASAGEAPAERPTVLSAPIEGPIDPVTKEVVELALERADEDGYDAVVFTMDTPGGLMTSMDDIIKSIAAERERPVIVYVAPSGARAASAGAFIAMSSDVIGMAPGTNIGSATPVQASGEELSSDMREKLVNDSVARITSMAREHGRNETFAENAVRKATNIAADTALERNVIEFVAPTLPELLDDAHGFTTVNKKLTLNTRNAAVTELEVPLHLRVLKQIIDPNILFLLFSVAMLGIAVEIYNPGAIFPGTVGVIALVIALFGMQVLPINIAGAVLIVLAMVLFMLEAFVASSGVLAGGGVIAMIVGGLLLFDRDEAFGVSVPVIVLTALAFGVFFGFVVRKALSARQGRVVTGSEGMLGEIGMVREELAPRGRVWIEGELWAAEAADGAHVPAGERVAVEKIEGLVLYVRPLGNEPKHAPDATEAPPDQDQTDSR